ncbi:MAG: hypothetical protein V4642_05810 [Bacteroidota bacterium]
MSKGGAGKVYFVLYLAVILELLIIIVERDEAEEHLMQKQKESMKIVQSILAQLQSGSGATGVNTRRSDEITLKGGQSGEGYDLIKEERRYFVDVGVTDVSGEISKVQNDPRLKPEDKDKRFAELVDLSNARELEYQIFYSGVKADVIPEFPTEAEIKEQEKTAPFRSVGMRPSSDPKYAGWQLVALRKLRLDGEATKNQEPKSESYKNPIYGQYDSEAMVGNIREFAPTQFEKTPIGDQDIFAYSKEQTDASAQSLNGRYKKRSFVAYFKPKQDGWYKVRFASKTNNILGVRGTTLPGAAVADEDEVNVGTVKLKVKELKAVRKEIARDLEGTAVMAAATELEKNPTPENLDKFKSTIEQESAKATIDPDEKVRERAGKMRVFSYIVQLLTPGATEQIDQNRSSTEFDVRVVSAPKRQTGDPLINLTTESTEAFDKVQELRIPFSAGPIINGAEPRISGETSPGVRASIEPGRGGAVASQMGGGAAGTTKNYDLVIRSLKPSATPYNIVIVHALAGKEDKKSLALRVFESKPAKPMVVNVTSGNSPRFRFSPSSGNAIAPEQFKILATVGSKQYNVNGIALDVKNEPIPSSVGSVNYRVEWSSPFAAAPIVLEEGTKAVGVPPPSFSGSNTIDYGRWIKNFEVIVKDIQITTQDANLEVQDPRIEVSNPDNLPIAGEPAIQQAGNGYQIVIRLDKGKITGKKFNGGQIDITVSATARNKSTGKVSGEETSLITVPFQKR